MKIVKNIDYNLKQNIIASGQPLLPNNCFQNCFIGINFDETKLFSFGYITKPGTHVTSSHGWLEDRDTIFELTLPMNHGSEYYKAFSINHRQLQKYLPLRSLECLIDHRHYTLSFCKTHNEVIRDGYNITLGGQLVPCKLGLKMYLISLMGHWERILFY